MDKSTITPASAGFVVKAQHFSIRTESAELCCAAENAESAIEKHGVVTIANSASSAANFKLAPARRIPPKLLHFRCYFGLTVNLSKSYFIHASVRPEKDNTFSDPSSASPILSPIILSSRGKKEKIEIF